MNSRNLQIFWNLDLHFQLFRFKFKFSSNKYKNKLKIPKSMCKMWKWNFFEANPKHFSELKCTSCDLKKTVRKSKIKKGKKNYYQLSNIVYWKILISGHWWHQKNIKKHRYYQDMIVSAYHLTPATLTKLG